MGSIVDVVKKKAENPGVKNQKFKNMRSRNDPKGSHCEFHSNGGPIRAPGAHWAPGAGALGPRWLKGPYRAHGAPGAIDANIDF